MQVDGCPSVQFAIQEWEEKKGPANLVAGSLHTFSILDTAVPCLGLFIVQEKAKYQAHRIAPGL